MYDVCINWSEYKLKESAIISDLFYFSHLN